MNDHSSPENDAPLHIVDVIRDHLQKRYGTAAVQSSSDGIERIYYNGIPLRDLADAVAAFAQPSIRAQSTPTERERQGCNREVCVFPDCACIPPAQPMRPPVAADQRSWKDAEIERLENQVQRLYQTQRRLFDRAQSTPKDEMLAFFLAFFEGWPEGSKLTLTDMEALERARAKVASFSSPESQS